MTTSIPLVTPLEHGDHLTRAEFERRWDATPNLKFAELLDGMVYIPQTGSHLFHGQPAAHLIGWTGLYAAATLGVEGVCHASLRLDERNEPQPDSLLLIQREHGGQTQVDADGFLASVPDWIGEVTSSRASYDLHAKLPVYRRHCLQECLLWRVRDKAIDWFVLRGNEYAPLRLSSEGYYKSEVFPGLWLDPRAMIASDLPRVQRVVQLGLASAEHRQFVERLARQTVRPQ